MKIVYVVPGVGLDDKELHRREQILNSMAYNGTKVEVRAVQEGPESIESVYDEYACVPPMIKLLKAVEKDYDVAIIGCYGDPGIEAAREVIRIPVVGPGESSMLFACMLGHKFSVITVTRNVFSIIENIADKIGVSKRLVSIRETGLSVMETNKNHELAKRKIIDQGKEAINHDGADTIILGCMSEAFLGYDKEIAKELRVPVINPVSSALKMAESMVSCGFVHSQLAYSANVPKHQSKKN